MAKAQHPFGLFPVGFCPGWLFAGMGGYLAYAAASGDPDAVDYATPLAGCQAGETYLYLPAFLLAAGSVRIVAVRSVSDAGVEDANVTCWCRAERDGEGELVGNAPNRLTSASAEAAAGGAIELRFVYSRTGERATAASVQVARVTGGVAAWDSPLATVALATWGLTSHLGEVSGGFGDGEMVTIALRAITSGGVAGPVTVLSPVAADSSGPPAIEYLAAAQVEDS